MYVNGKMIPGETVSGTGERGIKQTGVWGDFSIIYLIYCKIFLKCHNVPPHTAQQQ
jgi:hypothetical protein